MKTIISLFFIFLVLVVPVFAARLTFRDMTFRHTRVCPPPQSPYYTSVSLVVSHPLQSQLVTVVGHKGTTGVIYVIESVAPFSVIVRMYNPGPFCQAGTVTLRFWFVE